jgi:hypothetical protein
LYESGSFYDMHADPLEQNALKVDGLDVEATAAYRALSLRIERMPGELRSTRRWLPRQLYYAAGVALVALITIIWLLWRLARYLRRPRPSEKGSLE